MNRDWTGAIDRREPMSKCIERSALYIWNVPRLPFAFATYIENIVRAEASITQSLA